MSWEHHLLLQAFGCIDQDRDGVIKKSDLKETYAQLGMIRNSIIESNNSSGQ